MKISYLFANEQSRSFQTTTHAVRDIILSVIAFRKTFVLSSKTFKHLPLKIASISFPDWWCSPQTFYMHIPFILSAIFGRHIEPVSSHRKADYVQVANNDIGRKCKLSASIRTLSCNKNGKCDSWQKDTCNQLFVNLPHLRYCFTTVHADA